MVEIGLRDELTLDLEEYQIPPTICLMIRVQIEEEDLAKIRTFEELLRVRLEEVSGFSESLESAIVSERIMLNDHLDTFDQLKKLISN